MCYWRSALRKLGVNRRAAPSFRRCQRSSCSSPSSTLCVLTSQICSRTDSTTINTTSMATTKPDQGKVVDEATQQMHRIRVTLNSPSVKSLEKVCSELVRAAKENKVTVNGPVRMPTKTLRITTRKTPCGEGSKTWDRFQMRIHKRIIDLRSTSEIVKKITSIGIYPGVDIEFTIANS